MNTEKKLTLTAKIGYGVGQMADSIPYNLIGTFSLFFLTNAVGLPASVAGTISMIALLWDAITDPVVGHMSDTCTSRYGRRRPFMVVSLLPLAIMTVLAFVAVDFSMPLTIAYYIIVGLLFKTFYTGYVVPYFSLGAEITQDYDERVTIQSMAGYFIYIALWIVTAGPMLVIDKAMARGIEYSTAWTIAAAVFSVVGVICGLICWYTMRGREITDQRELNVEGERAGSLVDVFRSYIVLLKDKIMIYLILLRFTFIFAGAITTAAFVYLMSVNLQLSESQQALYWTFYSIIYIVAIAICNFMSARFDKKAVMMVVVIISIVVSALAYIHNINSFNELIIFTCLCSLCNAGFWTIGATFVYDYNEVVEFKTGKRQEGAVSGLILFSQKLGAALATWISGLMLSAVGYDGMAEVQSETVKNGILFLNTLAPSIVLVFAVVFIIIYPINKENFSLLTKALERKNKGEEYSTEGFEKLL